MAKSKSFFGLRTGSTKSHTYQNWRGLQVTKDRVLHVSNPQTTAQMDQRLIVPLVAAARTQLKDLVDHSFQGVESGYKSLYEFSRLNLRRGALTVGQYVPKGAQDCGWADFIISNGTAEAVTFDDITDMENYSISQFTGWNILDRVLTTLAEYKTFDDFVQALIDAGDVEGTQYTFVFLYLKRGQPIKWTNNGTEHEALRHGFAVARIIVKKGANPNWTVQATGGTELDASEIIYKVGNNNIFGLTGGDEAIVLNRESSGFGRSRSSTGKPTSNQYVIGIGGIKSVPNGNDWTRSYGRISVDTHEVATLANNTISDVLDTYLHPSVSAMYLDNGSENLNTIEGVLS